MQSEKAAVRQIRDLKTKGKRKTSDIGGTFWSRREALCPQTQTFETRALWLCRANNPRAPRDDTATSLSEASAGEKTETRVLDVWGDRVSSCNK